MTRTCLSLLGGTLVALMFTMSSPATANADDDWDNRHNNYQSRWQSNWRWYNGTYAPYYRNHYGQNQGYYTGDPRYYTRRPYNDYDYPRYGYRGNYNSGYNYRGYGNNYGYRDYGTGGSVNVGPLRFSWR